MTRARRDRGGVHASSAAALLAGVMAIGSSAAQEQGRLSVDVSSCVELVTPEERLACFDAQVERSRKAGNPRQATEPAAVAVPPRAAEAGVQPAAGAAGVPPQERGRSEEAATPLVVATVTELREVVPNSFAITLDNGQVWRQAQPMRFALRVGNEVQIYTPPWGDTLRLKVEGARGFIQVERVR